LRLLRSATDEELGRIDRLTYEVDVPAGRMLTSEGERPRGFFLIVSGRAIVTVAGLVRDILDSGTFFGETALLDGAAEPATVTALTPMQLRVATGQEFAQLRVIPPVAYAMLKMLAAQQRATYNGRASRLTAQPAEISDLLAAPAFRHPSET
jgi:CRP-like cAMP-binding protein